MGMQLVAIGGAVNPTGKAMLAFYLASGRDEARIAIIPTASNDPRAAQKLANALRIFGLKHAPTILPLWQRSQAQDDAAMRKALFGASGVLILGGHLRHLLATLYATRFHKRLREAATAGVVVGGISAGAAALSAVALLPETPFHNPLFSPPRWLPGLGLTERLIILPHFRQRQRQTFLLSAILYHAHQIGLGIDEDTAVLIEANRLHVSGNYWVTAMVTTQPLKEASAHSARAKVQAIRILHLSDGATLTLEDSWVDRSQPEKGTATQFTPEVWIDLSGHSQYR